MRVGMVSVLMPKALVYFSVTDWHCDGDTVKPRATRFR